MAILRPSSGGSGGNGASGYSGFSGYSGVGTSGFSGYSGVGTSGYSGYSGVGSSGYSGYSGAQGVSGFSGYSGRSGFSGVGTSGFSGYSGYSGKSGYSGAAFVAGTQAANKVYAGPTTGSAATPTFRLLVPADLSESVMVINTSGPAITPNLSGITFTQIASSGSNNIVLETGATTGNVGKLYWFTYFHASTGSFTFGSGWQENANAGMSFSSMEPAMGTLGARTLFAAMLLPDDGQGANRMQFVEYINTKVPDGGIVKNIPTSLVIDSPTDGSGVVQGGDLPFTWHVDSGNDEVSLIWNGNNLGNFSNGSGSLNGIIEAPGDYSFELQATHGTNPSQTITITVVGPPTSLTITAPSEGDYTIRDQTQGGDTGDHSFAPTWTVDGGDDTASVFWNGTEIGSGPSGSVTIYPGGYGETDGGNVTLSVTAAGGTNPSDSITMTFYDEGPP